MKRPSLEDSFCLDESQTNSLPASDQSPLSPADSIGSVFLSSETENGTDDKKTVKQPNAALQLRSNDAELENRRRLPLSRSKTYDSLTPNMKLERKKSTSNQFSKTNAQYHKLFKDVPKEEPINESFTCALQKEILYQGKLYISENWICFHSKVFGKDTKIVIPVQAVTVIKKTKTALLVPNALVIATVTDRFIFVSLLSRDTTFKLLQSFCRHLENTTPGNSPNPSSAEHSFRTVRPTSLPLDFSVDFSELDGLVRQRRKEMEEYSSTGSQTPESENSREFQVLEQNIIIKSLQTPVPAESHVKPMPERKHLAEHGNGHQRFLQSVDIWQILSLNGLLFFYAIVVFLLIISTLYMQSKIVYLEERLASLGPLMDSPLNEWPREQGLGTWQHINADTICDELTANLAKLDKIQRNLQRLLEDTN
ncbi:GRAM domain-containing protein 2B isoform X2 [Ascaphus truei]|uniref:GRAM domain-containing protein 2B isoform X2 n=1 Tax=Ascaphus truei TaxID=8439 RepID=UPI003F5A61EB